MPRFSLLSLILVLRGSALLNAAQPRLLPDEPIAFALKQGESRSWAVSLPAGHYAEVIVAPCPVNTELSSADLKGNNADFDFGQETLRLASDHQQTLTITVRGIKSWQPGRGGECSVKLTNLRPATNSDRRRLDLQKQMVSAKSTEELWALAREWSQVGDAAGELSALLQGEHADEQNRLTTPQAQRAIALAQQLQDPGALAHAYSAAGSMHIQRSEVERGFSEMEAAISAAQKVNDRWAETYLQIRTGSLYQVIDDNAKALSLYQKALPYARERAKAAQELEETRYLREDLSLIGSALNNLRRPAEALPYLLESLAIYREQKDERHQGRLITMLGTSYSRLKQYGKARDYHEQGLLLARKAGFPLAVAQALESLALANYIDQRFDAAAGALEESITLREKAGQDILVIASRLQLALIETGRKSRARALALVGQALEDRRQLENKLSSSRLRSSVQLGARGLYAIAATALLEAHELEADPQLVAQALEATEQMRARGFNDFVSQAHVDVLSLASPALAQREHDLITATERNTKQQTEARQANAAARQAQLEKEYRELTQAVEANRDEMRRAHPLFAAATRPTGLTWPEIQQRVLGPDDVLVQYLFGRWSSYVFAGTREGLAVFKLPAGPAVTEQLDTFTTALKTRDSAQLNGALAKIADVLVRPLAAYTGKKRWLIAPDADLYGIPLGPLVEAAHFGQTPEVVQILSATAIDLSRQRLAKQAPGQGLAVIADPVYRAGEERAETTRAAGPWQPRRLPFARREADSIARLAGTELKLMALGYDANRDLVLGGTLSQYRVIHFASHGIMNPRVPELSALVLSTFNRQGKLIDGHVRLAEWFSVKLNADLVVLSACDTATGVNLQGEGVLNLARGVLAAGARQVISTLWKVDDAATAEFMRLFYERYLPGQSAATSLAGARDALRQNPRYASPYYWAAFQLTGDPL